MKALFFNGGPRKNWSTARMLESSMKGAAEAGADVEMIHLYDCDFHGCRSCLACKLKNAKTNGVCAIRDELRPILEKAHEADVVVIGSPIYFSDVTGVTRAFLERLLYPVLSYNPKVDESGAVQMSLLGRTIPNAMIYTMGSTEEAGAAYKDMIEGNRNFLQMLYGHSEALCSFDTYMMSDYSRYDIMPGTEERRAKHRDEQFPKDLEAAYELGKRLVETAKEARAYDVLKPGKDGKPTKSLIRTTYLIDENGVITKAFGGVKPAENAAQMLDTLT